MENKYKKNFLNCNGVFKEECKIEYQLAYYLNRVLNNISSCGSSTLKYKHIPGWLMQETEILLKQWTNSNGFINDEKEISFYKKLVNSKDKDIQELKIENNIMLKQMQSIPSIKRKTVLRVTG